MTTVESLQETPVATAAQSAPRALFAVGGLYTEASGVARIVCDLANALSRKAPAVPIYTAACGAERPAAHMLDRPELCRSSGGRWLGRLSHSPELRRRLLAEVENFDVVHSHSLWMLPNHYACEAAERVGVPWLFTAHGALEPWALARSRWKKSLVGRWFQWRDLRRASCIQVNSRREAEGVRALGFSNPLPVVPNGVDLRPYDEPASPEELEHRFPELAGKRVALFLSRLHEKKGLGNLLPAWARLASDHPDWHLLIAGPDDGFEPAARQLVRDHALEQSVTFAGPLRGAAKHAALSGSDVFVLPSFSEGFSMVILEAMAARRPVLLTPGCNFPEAPASGAAVSVSPDAGGVERGLRSLLEMDPDERRGMGRSGRALVESHYSWDQVANQMLAIYEWMTRGGDRPAEVHWYD